MLNLIQSYSECHSVVYGIGFGRILNTVGYIMSIIIRKMLIQLLICIINRKVLDSGGLMCF